ncbi:MAG: phosphatase PAP2 family protein, partial [Pseudomonadota bacterium]
MIAIDQGVSRYFKSHNGPRLRAALGMATCLGTGAVWVPLYALFLVISRGQTFRLVSILVLAEVTGLFFIIILRYRTKRERPAKSVKVFSLTPWNRYSFPSHHALRASILTVVIGTGFPRLLTFLLPVAAVVDFSRIYLSKHYLSDVVVGC